MACKANDGRKNGMFFVGEEKKEGRERKGKKRMRRIRNGRN